MSLFFISCEEENSNIASTSINPSEFTHVTYRSESAEGTSNNLILDMGTSVNYSFNRIDEQTIEFTSTGYGNLESKMQ